VITRKELDELQLLVEQVNTGNAAFWTLVKKYPDLVRTKLGKDVSLKYLTCDATLRQALGNDLEIAIGEKNP
jgi:hypothetical protein